MTTQELLDQAIKNEDETREVYESLTDNARSHAGVHLDHWIREVYRLECKLAAESK